MFTKIFKNLMFKLMLSFVSTVVSIFYLYQAIFLDGTEALRMVTALIGLLFLLGPVLAFKK